MTPIVARPSRPLANRRVIAGYTQERLAEALGVDRSTIGRWERGEQLPQPWQRPDLACTLGVTLEQLDGLLRPPRTIPAGDVPELRPA
ncbi:helix-turn-helix transcriptional regulator [Amycolatopsis sacchari]|uniref:helix-turn-helix transcriptional regulator n=1 Tax=Amycolatopsis sacchari TaxID=115433 RepID=UPI003D71981A